MFSGWLVVHPARGSQAAPTQARLDRGRRGLKSAQARQDLGFAAARSAESICATPVSVSRISTSMHEALFQAVTLNSEAKNLIPNTELRKIITAVKLLALS